MSTPRSLLAVLCAVLVLALAGPVQAQNRNDQSRNDQSRNDRNQDRRYEQDFELDGRNRQTYRLDQRFRALGDQPFHIRGEVRADLTVREDNDGDVRITGRADGSDLVVTRLSDDAAFRLTGAQDVDVTIRDARQRESNEFRTVLDFDAVGRGSEPDYRVRLTVTGRIQRDGTVRAAVTAIDLDPRGRGGNDDDDRDRRYERDFELDGRNRQTYRLDQRFRALGDQPFHIRGEVRADLTVREDNDGDVRITGRADGSDLVVTRLSDDAAFRLTGAQDVDVTIRDARQRESNEFRTVLDFDAVGRGSEPDYRVRLTLTGQVQRDGTVRAAVTAIDLDRR